VNERRSRAQYADYLRDCVDCMLWDYLRIRLAPGIPPVDYDLPPGDPRQVDGYVFGEMLGRGMFGSVFQLTPGAHHPGQPDQVAKVVSKSGVKDLAELKCMRRQIEVMKVLASDQWAHPNLVKLYQTYHSPTHLIFRMEFGGPENLYRRLNHRQRGRSAGRPLPLLRCVALISQAINVVAHMHLGPCVCHRDLKPENFIVQDSPDLPFVLKLTDFDLAVIQPGNAMCRSRCGTLPFTAPEVLLNREYSGMAADIWSLGIVLLEVLCGVRVVEKAVPLNTDSAGGAKGGDRPDDSVGLKIRSSFQRPSSASNMLQARCRPELAPLVEPARPLLDGMLTVDTARRWNAEQMKLGLQAFPGCGVTATRL